MVASKSKSETYSKPLRSGLMKPTSTFYHTTAFLSKLSIILSVLAVFAIFNMISPHVKSLRKPVHTAVPKTRCVVYDRPPRTGSSTISKALARCLTSRGYYVANGIKKIRSSVVTRMLSSDKDRLAMAKSHVAFSEDDLGRMEESCGQMLYITGSSPMKKRLYSALKYSVYAGNENTSIDIDMVKFAENAKRTTKLREAFLEAYPHVTEERTPLDVIPERIIPDYVIRKENLGEDLQALLSALRCNATFTSTNVHTATTEESKVLANIQLEHGDVVYKWLTEVAKGNDLGLEKAREFGDMTDM